MASTRLPNRESRREERYNADRRDLMRRKVLMICYYYPPLRTGGTERSLKFARYLPDYGYEPFVLTARSHGTTIGDERNRIYRTNELWHIYRSTLGLLGRAKRPREVPDKPLASSKNGVRAIKRWLLLHALIPDPQIGWLPFAIRTGGQMVRGAGIDVIFSTSPPETAHLIAYYLQRSTGKPWVADFRDSWVFDPLKRDALALRYRRGLETFMERKVVAGADAVVCATKPVAQDFEDRCGLDAHNITVIPNGYDALDYGALSDVQELCPGVFSIVHTGSFAKSSGGRTLGTFLRALRCFVSEWGLAPTQLRLLLVGDLTDEEKALTQHFGLDEWVEHTGQVTRVESLQYQLGAQVLLLMPDPLITGQIPGKLYEYLAARKPILALARGNASADIISRFGAGIVVGSDDVEDIRRAISTLFTRWKSGQLKVDIDTAKLQQFDRRELTRQLAEVFDTVLTHDENSPRRAP